MKEAAEEALDVLKTIRNLLKRSDKGCNSFVPGVQVLVADGSTKQIEDVEIGDEVLATDPETGETTPRAVTAEIQGTGSKQLVTLTLRPEDGPATTITATDGHPFWVPELNAWIDAEDLQPGMNLETSTWDLVRVAATRHTSRMAAVHNLTIEGVHTYYVLAGQTPVLVHNCNGWDSSTGGLRDAVYDRIESAHGSNVAEGVDYQVRRMHDGSSTAADHVIPGIGHDADALGDYFASWRGRMTHVDTRTGSRVAYDQTRGVLIVENSYMIHGYSYNYDTFVNSGRYTTS
ncbi:polymorphic toxin-type HINT domain-containing protein [Streptomyces litchfieldiae]|uniref:Polymorphic toxin-type HINT domain-containing protein n=1 Tax=Streptomyces litchfieldiae TaxID=3075543 RepID=A0ABU2MXF8_9ACTN|nr:polymorphic toxin-type HINT domain-containing protein [Streptomyces sp. DSM 44938]MDT0346331.1 polymorphic toxin-type HINT domain-containing protein [Streptomyces sp. DSM 44938]